MSAQDYAALIVSIITIAGAFAAITRWLVKHYLVELKPNGGTSLKDSVARLEAQMQVVLTILEKK